MDALLFSQLILPSSSQVAKSLSGSTRRKSVFSSLNLEGGMGGGIFKEYFLP